MASPLDALRINLEFWEKHIESPTELANFIENQIPTILEAINSLEEHEKSRPVSLESAQYVFELPTGAVEIADSKTLVAKRKLQNISISIAKELKKYLQGKAQNYRVGQLYEKLIKETNSQPLSEWPKLLADFCNELNNIPDIPNTRFDT